MTSAMLGELLKSLGVLGFFLLLGFALRAKLKFLQKTFMPASVIGGFILLILGPIGLKVLPIPEDWITTWSLLPGILIVPVVTATPLGLKLGVKSKKELFNILPLLLIMLGVYYLQHIVGFVLNLIFNSGGNMYPTFGWELPIGYSGGHGTAGILGNMLQEMNLPYWETAQGVAITTATFGIVGGILIGMVVINWGARKGYTEILEKPSDIPENMALGYEKNVDLQQSLGRETTKPSSVDTISFHAAIIFLGCFLAYMLLGLAKKYEVPAFKSISVWAYGIIVMFVIWGIINKLNLGFLIDSNAKGKITGPFTEFAVIAAIASLPVKAVLDYIVPILILCILGYIFTTFYLLIMCKKYLSEYWLEHMVATFGMSTGVFLTGLLLLRVCDPEYKSPVIGNYSISFSIMSAVTFAIMPLILNIILTKGTMYALILTSGITIISTIGAIIVRKLIK
ncbi:MAG: sodium/glutamate symporter [Peptoniphilus sp.]|uniref:sodium/glutamate symporter n=1 Tax=Peptoniphilus sp. TaxID=1971214 RepID=UPI002A74A9AB|nr:sodium/glutamate symporter [Peptoniphilus sp.]MDY2987514.1 sodium/glutamate symporter [Peptoniphilus sp.]